MVLENNLTHLFTDVLSLWPGALQIFCPLSNFITHSFHPTTQPFHHPQWHGKVDAPKMSQGSITMCLYTCCCSRCLASFYASFKTHSPYHNLYCEASPNSTSKQRLAPPPQCCFCFLKDSAPPSVGHEHLHQNYPGGLLTLQNPKLGPDLLHQKLWGGDPGICIS